MVTTQVLDPSQEAPAAAVSLTAAAVEHIKDFAKRRDLPAVMRIGVRTSSCSAFAYTFELDDSRETDDLVAGFDDVTVVIDPKSGAFLAGTEIDYRREGIQEGFHFENPNVKGVCGCGESFTV